MLNILLKTKKKIEKVSFILASDAHMLKIRATRCLMLYQKFLVGDP